MFYFSQKLLNILALNVHDDGNSIPKMHYVLNLIYMFVLINAIYSSYRFEIVQKNSEKLWRYWRYAVIMDYRTRVPAPLNLIIRPFMLIYRCIKSYDGDKDKPGMHLIGYL